jgi:hypothetical protein
VTSSGSQFMATITYWKDIDMRDRQTLQYLSWSWASIHGDVVFEQCNTVRSLLKTESVRPNDHLIAKPVNPQAGRLYVSDHVSAGTLTNFSDQPGSDNDDESWLRY